MIATPDCRYGRSGMFVCSTGVGDIGQEPDWTSEYGCHCSKRTAGGLSEENDQDWRTSNGRNGNGQQLERRM